MLACPQNSNTFVWSAFVLLREMGGKATAIADLLLNRHIGNLEKPLAAIQSHGNNQLNALA
jgi:hypothetical protein